MYWKHILCGLLLACALIFTTNTHSAMAAQKIEKQAKPGRYQIFIDKTLKGKDYWTIFDTTTGVAKVFKNGKVHKISFPANSVKEITK